MSDAVLFRIADFLSLPMIGAALVVAGVALVNLFQTF
jgi:hypothetical protein